MSSESEWSSVEVEVLVGCEERWCWPSSMAVVLVVTHAGILADWLRGCVCVCVQGERGRAGCGLWRAVLQATDNVNPRYVNTSTHLKAAGERSSTRRLEE